MCVNNIDIRLKMCFNYIDIRLKMCRRIIMYRKIMNELKEWKDSKNRRPLILKGARQVREIIYIRTIWQIMF